MRCAIDCLIYLHKYYSFNLKEVETELEGRLNNKGLSIFDVVETLQKQKISCKVFKSFFLLKDVPAILYLKGRKSGHFVVLIKKNRGSVILFDPVFKEVKVSKWKLYLKWSHISVVCYN